MPSPRHPRLIGTADMMRLFGVSRQRAQQLQAKATFPAPLHELGPRRAALWDLDEVLAWAADHGRETFPLDD